MYVKILPKMYTELKHNIPFFNNPEVLKRKQFFSEVENFVGSICQI